MAIVLFDGTAIKTSKPEALWQIHTLVCFRSYLFLTINEPALSLVLAEQLIVHVMGLCYDDLNCYWRNFDRLQLAFNKLKSLYDSICKKCIEFVMMDTSIRGSSAVVHYQAKTQCTGVGHVRQLPRPGRQRTPAKEPNSLSFSVNEERYSVLVFKLVGPTW